MSFFSDITGAISGAGSIADAITAVSGVVRQALGMAHDKEQRDEGATAQRAETDEATLSTITRANAPVPTSDSDRLWDANRKKFGVIDGGAGKTG